MKQSEIVCQLKLTLNFRTLLSILMILPSKNSDLFHSLLNMLLI